MNFIKRLFSKSASADDTEKERKRAVEYWENGQYEECIRICLHIRDKIIKRCAKGKSDDFSLPFVNHFIYLGLYHLERWQDAYDFMLDGFFVHHPKDHAHFTSIAMELAWKVGEPAERVIHFGKLCYKARKEAEDREGMKNCAFTACNILSMMGECSQNRFFADILIEMGKEHRIPEYLIMGYGYLADNFMENPDPVIGRILTDAKAFLESLEIPSSHWTDRAKKSFENYVNYYSKWKDGENPYAEYKALRDQLQPLLDTENHEAVLDIVKKCLAIAENKFGRHHRLTAINAKDTGMSLSRMQRYPEALEYYLKELAVWEADMPAEGPALYMFCLMNIAETFIETEDFRMSESYYMRLLSEFEEHFDPYDSTFHFPLSRFPDVCSVLGRFDLAVEWLQRFIHAKEKEMGSSDHPDVLEQQVRLANVYIRMGNYAEAEHILKSALAFYTKTKGKDSKEAGDVLYILSQRYIYANLYSDAYTYAYPALNIMCSVYGEESRAAYQSLENMGIICQHLNRREEAETYFRRAKIILDKIFPGTHRAHGNYLNNMGGFKMDTDELEEAEMLLKKAVSMRESLYGRNHPDTATSLHNLGLVYAKKGENEKALSCLEEALAIRTETLGSAHPRVQGTKEYIMDIHRKTGKMD
ncbi:MAG: tetratricopeptide repeat protein [Desulfobacterales bacterium]